MSAAATVAGACPLCGAPGEPFVRRGERPYRRCAVCHLVWLEPAWHLAPAAEVARYREHNNDPNDPRYRDFLARLMTPLVARLAPGASGLDFGSGPGPTLALMLRAAGFPCANYDPHFAPDPEPLGRQHDFVACSETAEHFRAPAREFQLLAGLLKPGGWLALMTRMLGPDEDFATWYYPGDPTHVCFYQPATCAWLARHHGWHLELPAPHIALWQRPA